MRSSNVSSIVTIRSSPGSSSMRALSKVVLPDPVPPETRMLRRDNNIRSAAFKTFSGRAFCLTRSAALKLRLPNRRMVIATWGLAGTFRPPHLLNRSERGNRLFPQACVKGEVFHA